MERTVGTVVRGLRAPIFQQGDDVPKIAAETLINAARAEGFTIQDRDIFALTESVVARTQGNYAQLDAITGDLEAQLGGHVPTLGLVFPILSRNRFAPLLQAVAAAAEHIIIQFSYPADEVGNHLIDLNSLDEHGVDPWCDVLTEAEFIERFGRPVHTFTGMDYVAYYQELVVSRGAKFTAIFANDCREILKYSPLVLACDIHSRRRTKRRLLAAGAERVLGLDDLLTKPFAGSGYNPEYGLLGSNKADEQRVKLFPRDCQAVVEQIAARITAETGRQVEVMIYGDGAFKDPVGQIWELADPVVSPAFTPGLAGTPSELKLKYLADSDFADLSAPELKTAIADSIRQKAKDLTGQMASEGTTPRRLTDLIGSLCDLTSGSGDKGTPFVYIQGYFDSYAD